METIELIETLFDETRNVINQRLDTLERQIGLLLHHSFQKPYSNACNQDMKEMNCCNEQSQSEDWLPHFNALSHKLTSMSTLIDQVHYRLKSMEESSKESAHKIQTNLRTPILGPQHLEGLVMMPEIKVSKKDESDLDTKNIILQPSFSVPMSEVESIPDEQEVVEEEVVEEEQEEVEEQEVVEEEEEEQEQEEVEMEEQEIVEEEEEEEQEEEQEEALELEEWVYKGKKYFKDQHFQIYRQIDEETPEDEPFARYDEKTKTLKKLTPPN